MTSSRKQKKALSDLKTQAGLSNNGWDKDMKGLGKLGLTKVEKTEEGLFVEIVE